MYMWHMLKGWMDVHMLLLEFKLYRKREIKRYVKNILSLLKKKSSKSPNWPTKSIAYAVCLISLNNLR